MKKTFLFLLSIAVTSITVNQLINSTITNTNNSIKTEEDLNLNKNDYIIEQLNQEHYFRTDQLNNIIEKNLITSITLINNEIIINYQNLNQELYSETIYQTLLSSEYLDNLKIQYDLNLITFDEDHHINFNSTQLSTYNSDVWTEYHWYWFAYWRLHLSHNVISKIILAISGLGGISGSTIEKAAEIITGFLTSGIAIITAAIVTTFIIGSFFILLTYRNNLNGCWIGMLSLLPGIGCGGN